MANVNSLLQARTKQTQSTSKMKAMSKRSASGNLTSFSGIFSVTELSKLEKDKLSSLLHSYAKEDQETDKDLELLTSLTCEVKAINNQAAILHGERIKKAHQILTRYRDGAFTAWLVSTYGNRQTPYNLMQYYEFLEAMPKSLREQIESMPRQAVYVLATRTGSWEVKQEIVENYQGETKSEMLDIIRLKFPLSEEDKRQSKYYAKVVESLHKICTQLETYPESFSTNQKQEIQKHLEKLHSLIGLT